MSTLKLRAPDREASSTDANVWPGDDLEEDRRSRPIRVARVVSSRIADVSESEAVHGTIGVAMVALLGDPRLAVRAARVLLEDNSSRKRELRASSARRVGGAHRARR
jgi:hypothetical protein